MLVGRSLSELGTTLRWTDLRAFMASLGVESTFWRKIAPEATEKAARKAQILRVETQLLTMIYDAIWDVMYARVGSEHRPPRLLDQLLERLNGVDKPETSQAADRDAAARDVAARMRAQRQAARVPAE